MYYLAVSREQIKIQVLIRICIDKKVDCFGVNWVTLLMGWRPISTLLLTIQIKNN